MMADRMSAQTSAAAPTSLKKSRLRSAVVPGGSWYSTVSPPVAVSRVRPQRRPVSDPSYYRVERLSRCIGTPHFEGV